MKRKPLYKKICTIYKDGALAENTVNKWFTKFRNESFDLEDQECSGRPAVINDDHIKMLIKK